MHTFLLTQNFCRANTGTRSAQYIRLKDGSGGSLHIVCCNSPNKFWNINAGWTGFNARSIVAEKTPFGFDYRLCMR
ncbi:hypothetical protein ATPR_2519 [Acetobacter tropicalis NBRC 101654]|uniref:Uncharacterized protein n=1 Tax=Acetobacter tropicalis NBRC 101654 TaxID=749388 RepID=F7VGM0_9PROT|nr:hypothetical protein ATPR_2519 [Acetobacter tropicalis NBRC 101654]